MRWLEEMRWTKLAADKIGDKSVTLCSADEDKRCFAVVVESAQPETRPLLSTLSVADSIAEALKVRLAQIANALSLSFTVEENTAMGFGDAHHVMVLVDDRDTNPNSGMIRHAVIADAFADACDDMKSHMWFAGQLPRTNPCKSPAPKPSNGHVNGIKRPGDNTKGRG